MSLLDWCEMPETIREPISHLLLKEVKILLPTGRE